MENINNDTIELNRIIEKYSNDVNTRKKDPISSAKRRKAWEKIYHEYNQLAGVRPRTILQIRRYIHGRRYRSRKHSIDEQEPKTSDLNEKNTYDGNDFTDSEDEIDEVVNFPEIQDEIPATQDEITEFASAIASFKKKLDDTRSHQEKLNELVIRREKLQIKLLEQQLEEKTLLQSIRIQQENDLWAIRKQYEQSLYELKVKYEHEYHVKRMKEIDAIGLDINCHNN